MSVCLRSLSALLIVLVTLRVLYEWRGGWSLATTQHAVPVCTPSVTCCQPSHQRTMHDLGPPRRFF